MGETKYGKYFIAYDKEKGRWPDRCPAQLYHTWMIL